jgi:hypothetical protein
LTCRTGKSPFRWTNRELKAFDRLRIAVSSAPVLRCLDLDLPTFVTSDASRYSLCAVLEQEEDGHRRPAAFFSRSMQAAEQNYHPQEQELLVVVDSLRYWRAYLHGRPFTAFVATRTTREKGGRG